MENKKGVKLEEKQHNKKKGKERRILLKKNIKNNINLIFILVQIIILKFKMIIKKCS